MEFRKVVQLAICIIGVYCANISSMDAFAKNWSFFSDPSESHLENPDSEGPLWLNTTSTPESESMPLYQQQGIIQQQQEMIQQLIFSQQRMLTQQQEMIQQLIFSQQRVTQQQVVHQQMPLVMNAMNTQQQEISSSRSMPIVSKKPAPLVARKAI